MELSPVSRQAIAAAAGPELAPIRAVAVAERVALIRSAIPRAATLAAVRFGPRPVVRRTRLVAAPGLAAVVRGAVAARAEMTGGAEIEADTTHKNRAVNGRPQLFVGLPLDVVGDGDTINHSKAIAAGLKALKLLGVDGVEVPIYWGVVEKESAGSYNWTAYLELAQMVRDAGLGIRASLCFHASPAVPLPRWVSKIGDADPDIYFADREGRRNKECLSLAVDEFPVLAGKTPIQVFEDFCRAFAGAFSDFMGSTVTDVSIGLGPGGELRYPSQPPPSCKNQQQNPIPGVGEFHCYDKHMLASLKRHADQTGNHYWGLAGPHDAPRFDQSPESGNFFKDQGGSWESHYGEFFLSWYSSQLLSHADRVLSATSQALAPHSVAMSAKVPLLHAWHRTRSHPCELTAGYYNTEKRDGYDAVAKVFTRNSCGMALPGMDLADERQPQLARAAPEMLLRQILRACDSHGLRVLGENTCPSHAAGVFSKIRENALGDNLSCSSVESFTYHRMGAYFFSPEHWPQFTEFVRSIGRQALDADDRVGAGSDSGSGLSSLSAEDVVTGSRQMQAAV